MSSVSRQQLEAYLKGLTLTKCKVLDIGGSQLPINNRLGYHEGCEFHIMDLESPHEEKEKAKYIFDIQKSEGLDELGINRSFNTAFCIEVSEYWFDPLTALKNIHSLLVPDGILVISFHFIYPLHKPQGKDYLRYTKYGAIKLLEEAGFSIKQYQPRTVRHPGTMLAFYRSEQFKHDKEEDPQTLLETGCVIMAQKI